MEAKDEVYMAQQVVEIAEKLEALQKTEAWKMYMKVLDNLLAAEEKALRGQVLTKKYYKRIGFIQMMKYIKEIPGIVKDKKVAEYLLHQGRAKAVECVGSSIFEAYKKRKQLAVQKLGQMLDPKASERVKRQHGEDVYNKEG